MNDWQYDNWPPNLGLKGCPGFGTGLNKAIIGGFCKSPLIAVVSNNTMTSEDFRGFCTLHHIPYTISIIKPSDFDLKYVYIFSMTSYLYKFFTENNTF